MTVEWTLDGVPQTPVTVSDGFIFIASAPGAPTGVTGAPGDGEVALEWAEPVDDGGGVIIDYVIEYSADGGSSWVMFDDGVSAAMHATVTGLENGTAYLFRVHAVNSGGPGVWSELSPRPEWKPVGCSAWACCSSPRAS